MLYLPLASLTVLLGDLVLFLVLPLSHASTLRLCPTPLCYPNSKSIIPSIYMVVDYHFLRISLASLFVSKSRLFSLLMVVSILVRNLALASSNYLAEIYLRALSHCCIIPYIYPLINYCINLNYPPSTISISPQNGTSPCLLVFWRPFGPFL